MTRAVDYTSPIPGAVLKANGITTVMRYITNPKWPKSLSAPEVKDLRDNGIRILLNYEETADFMLGGYTGGMRCAQYARSLANGLGFSPDEPIIYSADFDATDTQIPTLLDFLMGAEYVDKNRGRVGGYGHYGFTKTVIDRGYIGWQTDVWSAGKRDPRAIAWQGGGQITLAGIQADLNLLNDNYVRTPMPNIPPSIAAHWPQLATEFPPNAVYDTDTAIIWSDAGARYAAEKADQILAAVQAIPTNPGSTVPVSNIVLSDSDVDRIAVAVVKKMSGDLSSG
jgi:hypothetical protein